MNFSEQEKNITEFYSLSATKFGSTEDQKWTFST